LHHASCQIICVFSTLPHFTYMSIKAFITITFDINIFLKSFWCKYISYWKYSNLLHALRTLGKVNWFVWIIIIVCYICEKISMPAWRKAIFFVPYNYHISWEDVSFNHIIKTFMGIYKMWCIFCMLHILHTRLPGHLQPHYLIEIHF